MFLTKKVILILFIVIILVLAGWYAFSNYNARKISTLPSYKSNDNLVKTNSIATHPEGINKAITAETVDANSKEAGFHVYYPVFIPDNIKFIKDNIGILPDSLTGGFNVTYEIGNSNSNPTTPWIGIVENKNETGKSNMILKKLNVITDKQEIMINGNIGYLYSQKSGDNNFNHLIFTTNDNVAIWLRSKDFSFEILEKIAKSMK